MWERNEDHSGQGEVLGAEAWDWGFRLTAFFTQLSATTAKRTALNSMQITTVTEVDKV